MSEGEWWINRTRCTVSSSKEWSSIGDNSIKIVNTNNTQSWYAGCGAKLNLLDALKGKTIKFTVDIKTSSAVKLRIFHKLNGNWALIVELQVAGASLNNMLTCTIPSDSQDIWFRIDNNDFNDCTTYTDNWRLIIQ